ncbi:hypothetical protein VTL71DRAFT_4380, partial [Oculimacula yallundae]
MCRRKRKNKSSDSHSNQTSGLLPPSKPNPNLSNHNHPTSVPPTKTRPETTSNAPPLSALPNFSSQAKPRISSHPILSHDLIFQNPAQQHARGEAITSFLPSSPPNDSDIPYRTFPDVSFPLPIGLHRSLHHQHTKSPNHQLLSPIPTNEAQDSNTR